jgi:PhzF family phenazine biosynthesis protein
MGIRISQVDAFTDRPFAGNPAGVCLLPASRDAAWMQNVAAEMNLAETAFLVRNGGGYDLIKTLDAQFRLSPVIFN